MTAAERAPARTRVDASGPRVLNAQRKTFSIAGVTSVLRSELKPSFRFATPRFFGAFEAPGAKPGVAVVVSSRLRLPSIPMEPSRYGRPQWRIRAASDEGESVLVEIVFPPTGQLYCRARSDAGYRSWSVDFEEETLLRLAPSAGPVNVTIPHPLDQLLWILPLASAGGVMQHAAAAIVKGHALVFLGRSGDGKTTLSRLLQKEGLSVLSDERVALRREGASYRVYGTPWAGEGGMVSPDSRPLRALFVLGKGQRHRVREDRRYVLAGEMAARSIVPYYRPDAAESVLTVLADLASRVPIYRLDVARRPGLAAILSELV